MTPKKVSYGISLPSCHYIHVTHTPPSPPPPLKGGGIEFFFLTYPEREETFKICFTKDITTTPVIFSYFFKNRIKKDL